MLKASIYDKKLYIYKDFVTNIFDLEEMPGSTLKKYRLVDSKKLIINNCVVIVAEVHQDFILLYFNPIEIPEEAAMAVQIVLNKDSYFLYLNGEDNHSVQIKCIKGVSTDVEVYIFDEDTLRVVVIFEKETDFEGTYILGVIETEDEEPLIYMDAHSLQIYNGKRFITVSPFIIDKYITN